MGWFGNLIRTNITPQVSGFRVQAINKGEKPYFWPCSAWTIGAGGDQACLRATHRQAPAKASFLNPEPRTLAI
jgi:hypothetical protein